MIYFIRNLINQQQNEYVMSTVKEELNRKENRY